MNSRAARLVTGALLAVPLALAVMPAQAAVTAPAAISAQPAASLRSAQLGPRERVAASARARAAHTGEYRGALSFRIWRGDATPVAASNLAVASATCRNCRAVAVSVQIVVAGHIYDLYRAPTAGEPASVLVSNQAFAKNASHASTTLRSGVRRQAVTCDSCSTIALAYQFVQVSRHRLVITPEARSRLAVIERSMRAVAKSRLSNRTVQARLDALALQIADVLESGVVLGPHP